MKKLTFIFFIIFFNFSIFSQIITNRKFPSGKYPCEIKTIDFKVLGLGSFTEMDEIKYEGTIAFKHIYELLSSYDEEGNLIGKTCDCSYAGMQNNPNAGVILGTYDLSSQDYFNTYTIYKSVFNKNDCLSKAESEKNLQNAKQDFNFMRIPINNKVSKLDFKVVNQNTSEIIIGGIKFKSVYKKVSDEKPYDMMCVSKLFANGELIYKINQQDEFYMMSGGKIIYISAFGQDDKVFFLNKFSYIDNGGGANRETYNFSPIFSITNFINKTKEFENFSKKIQTGWFTYKFNKSDFLKFKNTKEYKTKLSQNIINLIFENNKNIQKNDLTAYAIEKVETEKDFYIITMKTSIKSIEMSDELCLYTIAKTGKMIDKLQVLNFSEDEGDITCIVTKDLKIKIVDDQSSFDTSKAPFIIENGYEVNDFGEISPIKNSTKNYSDELAKLLSSDDMNFINSKIVEYQNINNSEKLLKFYNNDMPKFINILKKAFAKNDPSLQDLNKPKWIKRYVKFIEIGMDGDGGNVEPYSNYEIFYKKAQLTEGKEDDVFFKKLNY